MAAMCGLQPPGETQGHSCIGGIACTLYTACCPCLPCCSSESQLHSLAYCISIESWLGHRRCANLPPFCSTACNTIHSVLNHIYHMHAAYRTMWWHSVRPVCKWHMHNLLSHVITISWLHKEGPLVVLQPSIELHFDCQGLG